MEKSQERLTYKRAQANADLFRYVKAVAFPVGIFMLAMFTIDRLNLFGVNIVAPLTSVMWIVGIVVGLIQPSLRRATLRETHITIGVYLISITLFKELVASISGISSEMLMATYNRRIPVTSGAAFSGDLQTMLWITTIMTPVGFIVMEVKKLFTLRRTAETKKFHDNLLGVRKNGRPHD